MDRTKHVERHKAPITGVGEVGSLPLPPTPVQEVEGVDTHPLAGKGSDNDGNLW